MEKNNHFPPTDIPAMLVFHKWLPQGCLNHFLYMRGAMLPFIFSPKQIKRDTTNFSDTRDVVCVGIFELFQQCGFIFVVWLYLSTGVEVNRDAVKQADGGDSSKVEYLSSCCFHKLSKTLKSCWIGVLITQIKKTASLKLTFDEDVATGDRAARWLTLIVKVYSISVANAAKLKLLETRLLCSKHTLSLDHHSTLHRRKEFQLY